MSRPIGDVISSSTEDDDDNRQIRRRESANIIANKNAVNVRKGSPLRNINKNVTSDNHQMSALVSQTNPNSKHSAGLSLNSKISVGNKRPTSASQVGPAISIPGSSGVGGSNSLTNSPRSSSLASKKKSSGVAPTNSVYYSSSPVKKGTDFKSRNKNPERIDKIEAVEVAKNKTISDSKLSASIKPRRNIVDDSCSGRSSRCEETDDEDDQSSAEAESTTIHPSLEVNRRNIRRLQNRKNLPR